MSRRRIRGPRARRRFIPDALRRSVVKYKGSRCHYCKCPLDDASLTMDHVVPLSRGGETNFDNLVPACKDCNEAKGAA